VHAHKRGSSVDDDVDVDGREEGAVTRGRLLPNPPHVRDGRVDRESEELQAQYAF